MTRVRDQLRNQSMGDVIPSAFLQVGKSVYPDTNSITNLNALIQIVDAYSRTHTPTYGQAIPDTGFQTVGIENGEGVAAETNEVLQIQAISITNGGGAAPIEVKIEMGDVLLWSGAIPPNSTLGTNDITPFATRIIQVVKGSNLKFTVTSGTASDMVASVAGFKSAQG